MRQTNRYRNNNLTVQRQPSRIKNSPTEDISQSQDNVENPQRTCYDWNPKIANWIAGVSLLINGILAWYTWKVFKLSSDQANSVIESAHAATSAAKTDSLTLIESKRYNDENRTSDSLSSIKKDFIDSVNSSNQQTISNIQIATLRETKRQYHLENFPFVQILDVKYDTLEFGKKPTISYNIFNQGKKPIKILSISSHMYFEEANKGNPLSQTVPVKDKASLYLGSGAVWKRTISIEKKLSDFDLFAIKKGIYKSVIEGNLYYRNVVDNSQYEYRFKSAV